MKKKIVSFILILFLIGCKNEKSKDLNLMKDQSLSDNMIYIIDDYIKANPLKLNRVVGKSSIESGLSYPSYHLFFKKAEKDTVFSIIQFPSYSNFELEGVFDSDQNDTIYKTVEHKGWVMYKNKYPIIVFDKKNYSSNLIEKDKLLHKIPDSLKAGYNNQHIKFIKWDYQVNNGEITRRGNGIN